MAKFSDTSYPKLTAMFSGQTINELISQVKRSLSEGAEAFCILSESLRPEDKTEECFKRLFEAMEGRPAYVTNYIRNNSEPDLTDDRLAEQLLDRARWGASLIDVRTDMFCRSTDEVTRDTRAVQKQKALISELHSLGVEVIMSSHILSRISNGLPLRKVHCHFNPPSSIHIKNPKAEAFGFFEAFSTRINFFSLDPFLLVVAQNTEKNRDQ